MSRTASRAPPAQVPLFTLDTFKDPEFRVERLVSRLAEPLLLADSAQRPASSLAGTGTAVEAITGTCTRLLEQFGRADAELKKLHSSVEQRAEALRRDLVERHMHFEFQVAELDGDLADTQSEFQQLDDKMAHVGRVATQVGARLQSFEAMRGRATDAMAIIRHLQEFSVIQDLGNLPQMFHDEKQQAEAAAVTGRMVALAREAVSAKEREGSPGELQATAELHAGSIEYALLRLEEYRQRLKSHIIERFDAALAAGGLSGMAQAARILSEFDRGEDICVQRYISMRPMFMDVSEMMGAGQGGPPETALAAMNSLNGLFKSLLQILKEETLVMEQIFQNPSAAIAAFITRVFEQRLKFAVESVVEVPPRGAPLEAQQSYLKLLTEAFRRTHSFADKLVDIAGSTSVNTQELADAVFAEHLDEHLGVELAWLQQMYERQGAAGGGLSLASVTNFFSWNQEAVERCKVLCTDAACPLAVRQLFHSSTVEQANQGCLLEQVATHVIGGLGAAMQSMQRRSSLPFSPPGASRSPALAGRAAFTVAAEGIGKLLEAVNVASSMIRLLEQHWVKVVEPAVEIAPQEQLSCSHGLRALMDAVEARVLSDLQAAIGALMQQVEKTLASEQKRGDFQAKEDSLADLERPTGACILAHALLSAAAQVAARNLHAANLASFLAEMGRQLHGLLLVHMQRFVYSASGALRWKRDVGEYCDWVRTLHAPLVEEKFMELQALTNVLLVAPESLLGLVDGSLRLSHAQALKFICLREDWRSARVKGTTLASVFASDV